MTRVRFVRRWMIAVVLIMAVVFTQTVFAQTKTEIVIGTNLPLTGILKGPGGEQKWSYEQAVKDVNKNGGIWVEKY